MNETTTSAYPLDAAIRAFNGHVPITVKLKSGQVLGPGYIVIMYGDVAFRMQEPSVGDSYFVRVADVSEVLT